MLSKLQSVSLKLRVVLLVMVPLVIQLALVAEFMHLSEQSDRVIESAEKYGEVIRNLFEMNTNIFRLNEVFYDAKLDIKNAKASRSLMSKISEDFDAPIAKLKELSKGDVQSLAILASLEHVRNNLNNSVERLATEIKYDAEDYDKERLAKEYFEVAHDAAATIPDLERKLQNLAYEKSQESKRLKSEQRWMIVLFAAIDFGFALLATIALLNSTSSKLHKIRKNVDNYAHGKLLSPPSGGSDELDVIDQAFYETAGRLKVLHRKERALIYDSQDPIVFLDAQLHVVFVNNAASAIFRERSAFLDYVEPAVKESVATFLHGIADDADRKSLEVELILETRRTVILTAVLEPTEKTLLCIIHDITARHEVESMRQEIVSMFTHDLRNPLTGLTLALENLSEKPDLAMHSKTLKRAQGNLRRMSDLLGDLLDLYKTDAGMMIFEKESFPASALAESALQEILDAAEHLQVGLRKSIAEELSVQGDFKCTQRIVVNLLSNAIKFSPPGSIVELRVQLIDDKVAFQIVDNGPGISAEEQKHVFNRFQQASTSKGSRLPGLGSGLGLAICKAFSERQGGEMMVSSKLGVGSVFTCVLPRSERPLSV